ncbi:MAG: hypothetical protein WC340_15670 [Kiritimatiellia bacterium]
MRRVNAEEAFLARVREEAFWIYEKRPIGVSPDVWEREKQRRYLIVEYPFFAVLRDGKISVSRFKNPQHLELVKLTARARIINLSRDGDIGVPQDNGEGQKTVCEWCGGPFADGLGPRETGKRVFCSDSCKQRFRSFERYYSKLVESGDLTENLQLLHDLGVPGRELMRILRPRCAHCGGVIGEDRPITARFCSDKCRFDFHNEKKKSEN